MSSPIKRFAIGVLLSILILSSCQTATPAPTPTPVPPTAVPTATLVPTAVPQHPAAQANATRIDFATKTMTASPGELEPNMDLQVVFNAEAGRKIKINITIESGPGAALSLWGADGTVLLPETQGITAWEGVLPTAQDYYVSLNNPSPQPVGYQMTMILPPLVFPEATRIQFQPNTTGWYTPGELQPNQKLRFVLGAMVGQQMTVSLTTATPDLDAFLNVWSADGTIYTLMAPTKNLTLKLPASQDYYIEVISGSSQPVAYQLSVNIPAENGQILPAAAAPAAAPQTALGARIAKDQPIRFAVGPLEVELNGAVISGERDRYTLSASAGENLDVIITSLEANAVFTIIGPDNNPLPGTEEGKDINNWSVLLPMDGTYSILVGSTRGNATYTLKVKM